MQGRQRGVAKVPQKERHAFAVSLTPRKISKDVGIVRLGKVLQRSVALQIEMSIGGKYRKF